MFEQYRQKFLFSIADAMIALLDEEVKKGSDYSTKKHLLKKKEKELISFFTGLVKEARDMIAIDASELKNAETKKVPNEM